MAKKKTVVTVTGISNKTVTLSPHGGDITVNTGESVQFNIGANSGVASIDKFEDNSTNNIFSTVPNSGNQWIGVISDSAAGTFEKYTIYATANGSNKPVSHDPQITVNP